MSITSHTHDAGSGRRRSPHGLPPASLTPHYPTDRDAGEDVAGAQHYILNCLPQDADAVTRMLRITRVRREIPGKRKHRGLDYLIRKPWGEEYRIYDDVFLDAWLLWLRPGWRTSEHAHARKVTDLLCLSGHGEIMAGDGRRQPIEPGTTVHIDQGAVHATTAATELVLVEIETPRDKLDVVRIKDDNGRAGRGYEKAWYRDPRLVALEPVAGPAHARLRARSMHGRLRFGLEPSSGLASERDDLVFAIDLDPASILRRSLEITGPRDLREAVDGHIHLTIRSNDKEVSP